MLSGDLVQSTRWIVAGPPSAAAAAGDLRHERHAARFADAAEQRVQRVDGERGEQPVGLRQRSAADDRHGGPLVRQLACEALDARGATPVAARRSSGVYADNPPPTRRRAPRRGRRRRRDAGARPSSPARGRAPAPLRCPASTGIHSSAFAPVWDIRGSSCTNVPRTPRRPCRIRP